MLVKQAIQRLEVLSEDESEIKRVLEEEVQQGRAHGRVGRALEAELQVIRNERFNLLHMTLTDEEDPDEEE